MALTAEQQDSTLTFTQIGQDITALATRISGAPVNIKTLNVKGDGVTDDTLAIQAALADSSKASIFFPKGVYKVSKPIQVADSLVVRFDAQARIEVLNDFAANPVGGNDGRYVFIAGTNTVFDSVQIDCKGFKAGGIAVILKSNVIIRNCSVSTWRDQLFGLADMGASQVWYFQNRVFNGFHGIHSYHSSKITMSQNRIDGMLGGGIYTAWSKNVSVSENIVSNCEDVGIDFEGGSFCTSTMNQVSRCRNGELALFSGNAEFAEDVHHLVHQNNLVHRQEAYTKYTIDGSETYASVEKTFGALCFHSVAPGSYSVGFLNNQVTMEANAGLGIYHTQLGDTDTATRHIFVTGNTIETSGTFFRFLNNIGLLMNKNRFIGTAGSEGAQNEMRDASGLVLEDNLFSYVNTKTGGYALLLNTNTVVGTSQTPWATVPARISNNRFENTNGYSIQVDLFRNQNLVPLIESNQLGSGYSATGGLSVTPNGNVLLRDQSIKLRAAIGTVDLAQISFIKQSRTVRITGTIGIARPDYNGLIATLYSVKDPGALGVLVVVNYPSQGLSITTSGTVITLGADQYATGAGIAGFFDLTINAVL